MRLALTKLAEDSPATLVRKLRLMEVMDSVDPAAQVRRWRDGKHEPNYAVTMRLLEGLGMLREAAPLATSEFPEDDDAQVALLLATADVADEILKKVARIATHLGLDEAESA